MSFDSVFTGIYTPDALLDQIPVASGCFDTMGNLAACNSEWARLFKLGEKSKALPQFEAFLPYLQPCGAQTRSLLRQKIDQTFRQDTTRFVLHFGMKSEIALDLTLRKLEPGWVIACANVVIGYSLDLDDINLVSEREYKTAKLNELLLHNAPLLIGFVHCDDQFSVFDCNKKLLEAFGLASKEEFVARFGELHPEFQPCGRSSTEFIVDYNKKALQDGCVKFEYIYLTANGEYLPVETTIVRLDMRDKPILVYFNHDLRIIKNEKKKAQSSEEKTRLLLRAMPVACILINNHYEMIDCNRAVLDMAYNSFADTRQSQKITSCNWRAHCTLSPGCVDSKYRGFEQCFARQYFIRNFLWVFFPNAKTFEAAIRIVEQHCKKAKQMYMKGGTYKYEYEFSSFNGEIIPCIVTVLPVEMECETIYAYYFFDMRDEKLRQVAEKESLSKTRFLTYMSHEIRTPINCILGIAEIQLQNEKLSREIQENFHHIYNSARILLSIINDILDISKAAAGKMEIINQRYQLSSLIVGSLQMSLIHNDEKNITFNLNVDESLPSFLIGDELRLSQIMVNLITNAFKYTQKGSVTLNIGFEQAAGGDFKLVIELRDTGEGMSKEQIDTVLDEFVRFNFTNDKRYISGTGLGLPIASKLIQLMDGEMKIESAINEGSCFTVKIPQKVDDSQVLGKDMTERIKMLCSSNRPLRQINKIKRQPMPYGRVLIVDDMESNLHVAKQMILPYKINVQTAESGEEAISKIKSGEVYDIIFMDHMMPGLDGIETTKIIREMGYTFPIIALTANVVKGMEEIFLDNGFSDFMAKPIFLEIMDECLMRYIHNKQPPEVLEAAEIEAILDNKTNQTLNYNQYLSESFISDAARTIDNIELLLQKEKWTLDIQKAYTMQTHNIKGALFSVGFVSFSEEAQILENAGRDGDIDTIRSGTPRFLNHLKKLMAALESKKSDPTPQAISGQDLEKLRGLLSLLSRFCDNYDIDSINSLIDSIKELPCPQEMKMLIDEIKKHLLRGAFEEAGKIAAYAALKV